MAYADRLAQPDLAVRFAFRIGGIPYIFTDFTPPSGWLSTDELLAPSTQGGTERQPWLQILDVRRLSLPGQKLAPKGGLPRGGSWKVSLRLQGGTSGVPAEDLLRDLLTTHRTRADRTASSKVTTSLREDLDVAPTYPVDLDVTSDPWAAGSGTQVVYCGLETLRLTRTVSTTTVRVAAASDRGLYGSQVLPHFASPRVEGSSAESLPNGLTISDYPRSWSGRVCELWLITGYIDLAGSFVPYGATESAGITGTEHSRVETGILADLDEGDPLEVVVSCRTQHDVFRRPLVQRYPKARVGGLWDRSGTRPYIDFGYHNELITFSLDIPEKLPFNVVTFDNAFLSDGDTVTIQALTLTARTAPSLPDEFQIGVASSTIATNFATALFNSTSTSVPDSLTIVQADGNSVVLLWNNGANASTTLVDSDTAGAIWYRDTMEGISRGFTATMRIKDPGGVTDLTYGVYDPTHICQCITATIAAFTERHFDFLIFGKVSGALIDDARDLAVADPGVMSLALHFEPIAGRENGTFLPGVLTSHMEWTFRSIGRSILPYLGLPHGETVTSQVVDSSPGAGAFDMNIVTFPAPVPAFYWPPISEVTALPSRIFLDAGIDAWSQARLLYSDTFSDDEGSGLLRAAYIPGVGILRYTTASGVAVGSQTRYPLGAITTVPGLAYAEEALVIAPGEDMPEVTIVPLFRQTSWHRMVLYALLSGSGSAEQGTYDRGWASCGLYLRADLVDVDGILEEMATVPCTVDQWVWLPGDTLETIAGDSSVLYQAQLITDATGALTMRSMDPPLEADLIKTTPRSLTDATLRQDPARGFEPARSEKWVVNHLTIEQAYSYVSKRHEDDPVEVIREDSAQSFGLQSEVKLSTRGLSPARSSSAALASAKRVMALYAEPYMTLRARVAVRDGWRWSHCDLATLTHDLAPSPDTPGLGATDMPCRIVEVTRHVKPTPGTGRLGAAYADVVVTSAAYRGSRYSQWSPSFELTWDSGATWIVAASGYSTSDQLDDIDLLQVGYSLLLCPYGDFSATVERSITSLPSAGKITLSSAPGWTTKSLAWFVPYDDSSADSDQLKYCAFAGTTRTLTPSGGSAQPPFRLL